MASTDGRWSTLYDPPIYACAKTVGYPYRAALRARLTETLGINWGHEGLVEDDSRDYPYESAAQENWQHRSFPVLDPARAVEIGLLAEQARSCQCDHSVGEKPLVCVANEDFTKRQD